MTILLGIPIVIACVACAWCGYKLCEEWKMGPIVKQLENDIYDIKAGQRQLCEHLKLKTNGDTFLAGSAMHPHGIKVYINATTGDMYIPSEELWKKTRGNQNESKR